MQRLSLNLDMCGKRVIIVGGGSVALRKLCTLRAVNADVMLVAPDISPEIAAMIGDEGFAITNSEYTEACLQDAFLIIAATDNPRVNSRIGRDARSRGILVSVADDPDAGDCTFPATLRRGDLEIAVSTGGRCPTFATDVRDYLAGFVGNDFETILDQLAEEREKLLTNGSPSTYNACVLRSLARQLLARVTERKESLP